MTMIHQGGYIAQFMAILVGGIMNREEYEELEGHHIQEDSREYEFYSRHDDPTPVTGTYQEN